MTRVRARLDEGSLDEVLEFLERTRGFDHRSYKASSLSRRVAARMEAVGADGYAHYLDHLELHPEEFERLFNALLINVTTFFRDPLAWRALETAALPQLLAQRSDDARIRVWSAGCSTGQEAYTLAMVLCEVLGRDAFVERVKIYATDLDEQALSIARNGTYAEKELEGVPPALLKRYFQKHGARRTFDRELRQALVFGRHDLLKDSPISRVDLLVFRNTLMYFNAETQERLLRRMHQAMNEGGILFLGRAEAIVKHVDLFRPIELTRRLYSASTAPRPERKLASLQTTVVEELDMKALAFDQGTHPTIVLDATRCLAAANERARVVLGITPEHLRLPIRELPVAADHPTLGAVLHRLQLEGAPVALRAKTTTAPVFELRAGALMEGGMVFGYSVAFVDVSKEIELEEDAMLARTDLATMRGDFMATREALDMTNEELRTAIEELETTNEQLQSANGELEVLNGELATANEELSSANEALAQGARALTRTNAQLASLLEGIRGAMALVDGTLRVRVCNEQAKQLFGLDGAHEVRLTDLKIGLPLETIGRMVEECVAGATGGCRQTLLDGTDLRGEKIRCMVTCTPVALAGDERGAVLLMEEHGAG